MWVHSFQKRKVNTGQTKNHTRVTMQQKITRVTIQHHKSQKIFSDNFAKRKGAYSFPLLKQQKKKQSQSRQGSDVVLITKNIIQNIAYPYYVCFWFADSCATLYATNLLTGKYDIQPCNINITNGNRKLILSSQKDKKNLEVMQPNQKSTKFVLHKVQYVPDLMCNIYNTKCAMSNSAGISGLELTI